MKSQVPFGFILLDNQILINYVTNQTYIFQASKHRQIQVNCFLNLKYEFKYPMTGFRLPPLTQHVMSTFCCLHTAVNSGTVSKLTSTKQRYEAAACLTT